MADTIATIQFASEAIGAFSILLTELIDFVPKVMAACALIAAVTPPPDPESKFYPVLKVLDRIINAIAANIGHAKNANRRSRRYVD
jgi:hypothetical protein